ncbi:MAG: hypothetical protein LBI03_04555 [Clostridiales bacterium]|nr:hypothetical protein [Clostridiales bacterium]
MKKERIELMNLYIEKYRESAVELGRFLRTHVSDYIKGSIITKKAVRKINDTFHVYEYKYLEYYIEKDGKKVKRQKYIKKDDVANMEKEIKERNEYKKQKALLQKNVKIWQSKLSIYEKQGAFSMAQLNNEIENYVNLSLKADHHRLKKNNENNRYDDYKNETENGDRVRSKNEAFVGNILSNLKIPYFYERELKLIGGNFKPDYELEIDGKPLYIEILGIMDNEDYRNKWQRKYEIYKQNGIELGKNLLCFSIDDPQELNCRKLKNVLENFVKRGKIPKEIVKLNINKLAKLA